MREEPEKQTEDQPSPRLADAEPSPGEDFSAPAPRPDAVEETIGRLQEENKQLRDQLLRNKADMENVRKRLAREKEEFLQFSLFNTVQSLLPILDGFELALQSDGGGEDYRKGVELIYQQLSGALQRMGLETIEVEGKQFDPNLHEAILTVESDQYEDQQIVAEIQRGYFFKQRLLRPARVKVARRSSPPGASAASDLPTE